MAEPAHAFLRACRRLPVERIPVWMMRQAGRYQASYRKVREKVGFLELCRSPELIAQATAPPTPITNPSSASHIPCRTTSLITSRDRAPSAILTPISRVRWLTA